MSASFLNSAFIGIYQKILKRKFWFDTYLLFGLLAYFSRFFEFLYIEIYFLVLAEGLYIIRADVVMNQSI